MRDVFGDRMKLYEQLEAGRFSMPCLPLIVRLDGKNFSNWTRKLEKPYDKRLSDAMIEVTKFLVAESNAVIGYTQSDEITLILYNNNPKGELYFKGKFQKITSVLASMASAKFNQLVAKINLSDKLGYFDCRAWNVPNKVEAVNALLWREYDATKNSVIGAASQYYSHNEMMHKHEGQQLDMLLAKGINWNDYPAFFKRGTYVQRHEIMHKLTDEELAKIPKQYQPQVPVSRNEVVALDMPIFTKVTNKIEVVFESDIPTTL